MPALEVLESARNHEQASLAAALCVDAFEWMRSVLQWPAAPSKAHDTIVEHWLSKIETGVALHQLLAALVTSEAPLVSYQHNAQPQSFQARDNLASFGKLCVSRFQLAPADVFESEDLVLRKNPKAVALTILQLSRAAHAQHNVEPAASVKLEQEIRAQVSEDSTAASEDHEEEHSEISEGAVSAPVEEAKEAEPAVPALGDHTALDAAITAFLAAHQLKVRVVKVEIRNKKKRRNENRKAEYLIGAAKDKVHVRMLHGVLVARVDDDWKSFETLVRSRM